MINISSDVEILIDEETVKEHLRELDEYRRLEKAGLLLKLDSVKDEDFQIGDVVIFIHHRELKNTGRLAIINKIYEDGENYGCYWYDEINSYFIAHKDNLRFFDETPVYSSLNAYWNTNRELIKYKELDKNNLLPKFPFKIGDIVYSYYSHISDKIAELEIISIEFGEDFMTFGVSYNTGETILVDDLDYRDIGIKVFSKYEDAEKVFKNKSGGDIKLNET